MDFSFLDKYRDLAVNTYHVDPVIFMTLYLISIPIFWIGVYLMGREILGKRRKNKERFLERLIFLVTAWLLPYLYLMFFGKNLPIWFWFLLVGLIVLTGYKIVANYGRKNEK